MGQKYDKSYAERAAAFLKKKRTGKTDTDKMTPEQIAAEKRKQHRLAEAAPGLTYGDLVKDTRAAAQQKFGEAGRQLKAQPKRINSWFDQYQQAIADAQVAQKGATAGAVQGVQNLQSGLDDASQKAWAGQHAAASADAANRGATVDPKLADVAHNASNVRNALTGSYGAMLLSQGANENAYLGKRKVNAEVGRVDSLKLNAQQRQALARERGAFKQTYRGQAIGEAQSNALKNALTVSTIAETAAKTQDTKTDTAKTAAEIAFLEKYGRYPSTTRPDKNNSPQDKLDRAKLAFFNEHGYFPRTGKEPKGDAEEGRDWGTQQQQNAARDKVSAAVSVARSLKDKGYSREEAVQLLVNGRPASTITTENGDKVKVPAISKVARDYAAAALDVAYAGKLSAQHVRALRKRGIRVKGLGYKMPGAKVKPKPTNPLAPFDY